MIRFRRDPSDGGDGGREGNCREKHVARLSRGERSLLETLIRTGSNLARRRLKARILLKADVSEAGEGWSDNQVIEALATGASMVYRVRKQLVEDGVEAVPSPSQTAMGHSARANSAFVAAMEDVPAVHTRAHDPAIRALMTRIVPWSVSTKPQGNSSPQRACRLR